VLPRKATVPDVARPRRMESYVEDVIQRNTGTADTTVLRKESVQGYIRHRFRQRLRNGTAASSSRRNGWRHSGSTDERNERAPAQPQSWRRMLPASTGPLLFLLGCRPHLWGRSVFNCSLI
jgi:hypothetical protein